MSGTLTVRQQVPVLPDCDVLVVGAGASGFAAAVAAKQGVPVNAVDIVGVQDELRRQGTVLRLAP